MKKILVFYGSYGGGHLSAAKAISSYISDNYKDSIEVKMVDCIEYINKYINKVSTEAYKELAKKAPWAWKHVYKNSQNGALSHISNTTNRLMSYKLNQLLQEFKPDLIISTHPFSTQMCAILKKRGKIDCKIATVLTDFHIHAQWLILYQFVDYFFVSNEQMKYDMIAEGVHDEKIFVTGIPVSEKFSGKFNKDKIYKEFGLSKDKLTVLFFAGGEFGLGRNITFMVLKALIRLFKNLQVVAISGRNKKMNKKFRELVEVTNSGDRVKILEYTNKVPELMHIALGVITKPGGLTVSESLVSHLPIVVINPIPGQEEENAEFLVKNNVAIWIKKGDNIARALKELSRDTEKMKLMAKNAESLAKPNATTNICETLINEFEDINRIPNKLIVSILIKCKDKYLFIEQNKNDSAYPDSLHIVGGGIEDNETPEQAIKREVLEEVNIELDKVTPYDFDSDILMYKGKLTQLIFLRYTAEIKEICGSPASDAKKILWLDKKEILNYKHTEPSIRLLKKLNII